MHNLAVLANVMALDKDNKKTGKGKGAHTKELETLWKKVYLYWNDVIHYEGFWSRVNARIRELEEPRLTSGVTRGIRASMPVALLSVNACLAVKASEE